ncbi:MAG TPA: fatty acid desaturase [Polyangiaceae bacterium]|jgi:fatty acid desaturase
MQRWKGTWVHDALGAWMILWCYAPIVAAAALFSRHPNALTFALAFVISATRQNALFVVAHESWHYTLFRSRRANVVLGTWLAAFPILLPWAQARHLHLEHHRKVGTANDPDRYAWGWQLAERGPWVRHMLAVATGLPFASRVARIALRLPPPPADPLRPRPVAPPELRGRGELAKLVFVQIVIGAAFTATIGWPWFFAFWVAPLLTLRLVVDEVRQFLEHREGRLVVYHANPLERFALGAFNFHLHAVHHVFASEPWFCLGALESKALAKRPEIAQHGSYAVELFAYLRGTPRMAAEVSRPDEAGSASSNTVS